MYKCITKTKFIVKKERTIDIFRVFQLKIRSYYQKGATKRIYFAQFLKDPLICKFNNKSNMNIKKYNLLYAISTNYFTKID